LSGSRTHYASIKKETIGCHKSSDASLVNYQPNLNRQTLVLFNDNEKKLVIQGNRTLKISLWQNRSNIIERKKLLHALWGNDSSIAGTWMCIRTKLRGQECKEVGKNQLKY